MVSAKLIFWGYNYKKQKKNKQKTDIVLRRKFVTELREEPVRWLDSDSHDHF